ncbi:MAG: Replication initiator protein (RepA) N-terminus [Clostridia bacterium]|jgi:hypothetical protein|nr:Replication initiator protein (RepA) N-terminus [Clostridia bacterium]
MFTETLSLPIPFEILAREDLTASEKIIYSLLRFRFNLSQMNPKYTDDKGAFVIFEQKEIMQICNVSKRLVITAFEKLSCGTINLIERVAVGRTFKIYFKPYEVEERFKKSKQKTQNPHGNEIQIEDNSIGAEKVIHSLKGAEKAPNQIEIGAEKAPYNNINTNNNTNNINNNNITLLRTASVPVVIIDDTLYKSFNRNFGKKPTVAVKQEINALIKRGFEVELIENSMTKAGRNGWSWGSALKELKSLELNGVKTVEDLFNFDNGLPLSTEPSEWSGIDQIVFM